MKKTAAGEPRRRGRPLKASLDAAALIRAAALNVFARSGFDGASIVEIARTAAVAKPLIHYHFATKEALWQAAVGEAFHALQAELLGVQQQESGASGSDRLRSLARQMLLFASRYPQLVRIVVEETGKPGPRADWLYEHYLIPMYLSVRELLNSMTSGRPNPGASLSAEHLVPLVLGVMNFPYLESELIRRAYAVDVYSSAYIEQHSDLLHRVLMALFAADE